MISLQKLWVNGKYVGSNVGGYHRFSFDITNFIVDGMNNFTIKVEDSLSKNQPRGKQRYKKDSFKCWYIQTTGIWKTIWIESVPKIILYLQRIHQTMIIKILKLNWKLIFQKMILIILK